MKRSSISSFHISRSTHHLNPAYLRTQRGQLGFYMFIAAVQMIDAINDGLALRHQAGDDQTCGGTQIGRHDGRAFQLRATFDDGGIALDIESLSCCVALV